MLVQAVKSCEVLLSEGGFWPRKASDNAVSQELTQWQCGLYGLIILLDLATTSLRKLRDHRFLEGGRLPRICFGLPKY